MIHSNSSHRIVHTGLLICGILVTSGCASPEFAREANICSPEAYERYPVQLQQVPERRTRVVERGTGRYHCYGSASGQIYGNSISSSGSSTCYEMKTSEVEEYTDYKTIDANKREREGYINSCAMRRCLDRHGYGDKCKGGL